MKVRLAVAVILAALLAWAVLQRRQAEPAPPNAARTPQPSAAAADAPPPQPSAAKPAEPLAPAAADGEGQAERPVAAIRQDYEREVRDPSAPAAEQRIRTIYGESSGILRDVRCSESVCKLDARWSRSWNEAYNAALLQIIAAFSRELTLEAAGPPDGASVPVTIYVRRQRTL